jgi:hypothetical protein
MSGKHETVVTLLEVQKSTFAHQFAVKSSEYLFNVAFHCPDTAPVDLITAEADLSSPVLRAHRLMMKLRG